MKEEAGTSSFDNLKMPLQAINMIISKSGKIKRNIKKSIENYEDLINYGPLRCPKCESSQLIRWGKYERTAIYIEEKSIEEKRLTIQRYRCKSCGKTHGILPEGLIPYKQFGTDIIIEVLSNPYSKDIESIINITDYISYETVKRWQKQFKLFEPYLITMFKTSNKTDIFRKIKENIIEFYEEYYKRNHKCFMQIKILFLNMCPL